MNANENILLIRLKSIGDILFTLPSVHLVRQSFPGARITFLVSREYAPLLEGFRDVDAVIALDRAVFRRRHPAAIVKETVSLLRRLRRAKFSLAIDFQGYGETALLTWWSGAPQRWGSVYAPGRKWAYTQGVERARNLHPAERSLRLLQQCGLRLTGVRNQFALSDGALDEARRFFLAQGLDPARPTLFIQPLTSTSSKNWPLDRSLAAARFWQRRGLQVIFGGGPAEQAALEPVRREGFPVSAGAPLLVNAGLMKLSTLVLGGDTGLVHLAVAMDKRVVMINRSVGSSFPFQHQDWAVTPPPGKPVSVIPEDRIIGACARALAELGVGSQSA